MTIMIIRDYSAGVVASSPNLGVFGYSNRVSNQGAGSRKAGGWGDTGGPSGSGYYGCWGRRTPTPRVDFITTEFIRRLVAKNNAANAAA